MIASNNHLWNVKKISSYCPVNGAGIWGPFFKGLSLPEKPDLAPHFETVNPPFHRHALSLSRDKIITPIALASPTL